MSDTTEQLAAAIDRLITKHGTWYGRMGYLLLVLLDDPGYLLADLTTHRETFIRMLAARAGDLRKRGFELTFSQLESGPCVLIEKLSILERTK